MPVALCREEWIIWSCLASPVQEIQTECSSSRGTEENRSALVALARHTNLLCVCNVSDAKRKEFAQPEPRVQQAQDDSAIALGAEGMASSVQEFLNRLGRECLKLILWDTRSFHVLNRVRFKESFSHAEAAKGFQVPIVGVTGGRSRRSLTACVRVPEAAMFLWRLKVGKEGSHVLRGESVEGGFGVAFVFRPPDEASEVAAPVNNGLVRSALRLQVRQPRFNGALEGD